MHAMVSLWNGIYGIEYYHQIYALIYWTPDETGIGDPLFTSQIVYL